MAESDAKDWSKYLNNVEIPQAGTYNPLDDEEHPNCGTPDCCGQCETQTKYTQRDWDRTVGYGKVPKKYEKK